ncbi:PucR family transcriptional regulator [Mycolicibacterium brumae]|uniref:PucR family transcriptional regulator n=1 Tax=Mycolicibacterium brumae TaxID=85968 RepID=A0A2G5PA20_9MYCO|nr:PucR family transcriptional regulator [Mycolicibacterium brumae]MCV7192958.1 PucR family transcriptional regulator [Mycolicibacterium brumae]PIB75208.1 PucR family transcriptional regulator [Mycolicibacterium brumae]UWW08523.1 PucR family transcriptional regulator [Mycolicibacterium brumae]
MRWVLDQPDLQLRLLAGRAGAGREVNLVLTTELADPAEWLSGGELVLTTGISLPTDDRGRRNYLRTLAESGVAAVGFGTGLTFDEVPADLIADAEQLGLPLIQVPRRTPFAAIVQRVGSRLAALQYDAVLRASRAQPRMSRAVVSDGPAGVAAELGRALKSAVVVLDPAGAVIASHPPNLNVTTVNLVRDSVEPGADSAVRVLADGTTVAAQDIRAGGRSHGLLAVVSPSGLSPIDQVLLGHANSLLALDFEKPVRLQDTRRQLNEVALGLLLASDDGREPAWAQLAAAADAKGRIRVLVIEADAEANDKDHRRRMKAALARALEAAGRPVFVVDTAASLTVLLPGTVTAAGAAALLAGLGRSARASARSGLSGVHPLERLTDAARDARMAASIADRGGDPLEFGALTGSALLAFGQSREVLMVLGAMLTPVIEHDAAYGTGLMPALRAFLEANGHWESASAAIGVHRHTMRKRIEQAAELLGCDLGLARVRAELLLAILAQAPDTEAPT